MTAVIQPWHVRPRLEQFIGHLEGALEAPDLPAFELQESFAMTRLLGNMANMELAQQDIEHMTWRDGALRRAATPYDLPTSVLKHAHEKRIEAGDVEERGYRPPSEADYLSREWSESIMADPSITPTPFSIVDEAKWKTMFAFKFGKDVTPEDYRGLSPHWKAKVRADHKYLGMKVAREEAVRAHEAAARAAKELDAAEKRAAAGGLITKVTTGLGAMSSGLASGARSLSGAASSAGGFVSDIKNLTKLRFSVPDTPGSSSSGPSTLGPSEASDLRPASYSRPSEPGTGLLGGPHGFHPIEIERARVLGELGMNDMPEILQKPFRERAYFMSHVLANLQKSHDLVDALRTHTFSTIWSGLAENKPIVTSQVPELRRLYESEVSRMTGNARSVMLLRALLHAYEDHFMLAGQSMERSTMQLQSGQRLLGAIENMATSAQIALAANEGVRDAFDTGEVRETPVPESFEPGSSSTELSREAMVAAIQARLKSHQTDRDYQEEQMRETAALIGGGSSSSSNPSVHVIPHDLPTDRDFTDYQDPRLVGITPSVAAPFGHQRPDQAFANVQAMAAAELEPQTRILSQANVAKDPRRRT